MGLGLFISVALAASGPVGVALSSARPGADGQAAGVISRVEQSLAHVGVPQQLSAQETKKRLVAAGFSDSRKCAGARKCLRDLALILGPNAVLVGVDVAHVGDELVVHLEAVAADGDAALAVKDATVKLKNFGDALVAPLTVFARELKAKLPVAPVAVAVEPKPEPKPEPAAEPKPAPEPDRPVAQTARLEPAPAEALGPLAPRVVAQQGPRGTVVAGAVTGAAAIVAAAIAVTFTVLAANDQAKWEASRYSATDGQLGTSLSGAQADALVAQGNARYSVALGTGIGAGALALTSIILLTR